MGYHGIINERRLASYTATMLSTKKVGKVKPKKRAAKRFGVNK